MTDISEEIQAYYNLGNEGTRLLRGMFKLEAVRTREILRRFLPDNGTILDVGGGTGPYAFWLAEQGYDVHLIDAMPLHIEQAQSIAAKHPEITLKSASVGDARDLQFEDECADAVLLLGPMYHLTEQVDRIQALREAFRVLKPGGVVLAAVISRYASMMVTIFEDRLDYAPYIEIVERDLVDGQHRESSGDISFFTTAYFHKPAQVRAEIEAADFEWEITLAVEGPGWIAPDFDNMWANDVKRDQLIKFVRTVETVPEIMGMSPHLIGVGKKST